MDEAATHCEGARCASVYTRVIHGRGNEARLYVLYVPDGTSGAPQPFAPLVRYFIEHGAAGRVPWQREAVYAVGLLIDFLGALGTGHETVTQAASRGEGGIASMDCVPTDALRTFAEHLVLGTFGVAAPALRALGWMPCSTPRASRLLSLITAFTDWASNRTGKLPSNPWRDATPGERLVAVRRRERASANALLRHATSRQREEREVGRARTVQIPRHRDDAGTSEVKAFDAATFPKLLMEGFRRRAPPGASLDRRLRLRDALIALLLHGGGLRVSEVFHLWVGDVSVDVGSESGSPTACVQMFHPQRGTAPSQGATRWRDREHCLRDRWGLLPRNLVHGRFHAGWKNLALTDMRHRCARVEWFPTYWGEVFLSLYRAYLDVRPSGLHPYLFVSESHACRGEPYTIAAYEQALACAVRRIGLVPEKNRGTTAHGHRHAYGRALAGANLDPLIIQRAMHHRSPESQLVYTTPNAAQLSEALREATERVWRGIPDPLKEMIE
jgi:integrase